MAKHTPGPWTYKKDRPNREIVGPKNELIALIPRWIHSQDHEANAILLAAAPDLLEALYNLVDLADPFMTDDTQTLAMTQARAALKRCE